MTSSIEARSISTKNQSGGITRRDFLMKSKRILQAMVYGSALPFPVSAGKNIVEVITEREAKLPPSERVSIDGRNKITYSYQIHRVHEDQQLFLDRLEEPPTAFILEGWSEYIGALQHGKEGIPITSIFHKPGAEAMVPYCDKALKENIPIWLLDIQPDVNTKLNFLVGWASHIIPQMTALMGLSAEPFVDKIAIFFNEIEKIEERKVPNIEAYKVLYHFMLLSISTPGVIQSLGTLFHSKKMKAASRAFQETVFPFLQDSIVTGRDLAMALKIQLLSKYGVIQDDNWIGSIGSQHNITHYIEMPYEKLVSKFEKYLPILLSIFNEESIISGIRIYDHYIDYFDQIASHIEKGSFPEIVELVNNAKLKITETESK